MIGLPPSEAGAVQESATEALPATPETPVGAAGAVWVVVGLAVHTAVATIAAVGRQVNDGATGVAGNLNSAGDSAGNVPLVGDSLSKPLRAASEAALDIAGAGQSLDTTATWLAWVLALAVAAPPILAVVMPWLFMRIRFFRRKWTAMGSRTWSARAGAHRASGGWLARTGAWSIRSTKTG